VTKGAGRVSEVNARFTLDAMPGKQMSIDADLNAGVIDQETAKKVMAVLEKQIRQRIYDDICSWEPISNRKQILKVSGTMDNALLGVQHICANIALGEKDGTRLQEA
jgi:hypothetical protein